jgi:5-oxoprolinase (ATP-hydrolysing)
VLIHPLARGIVGVGMGLAELRDMREVQFDAPLSDVDRANAQLAIATDARDAVVSQGAKDVRTDLWAHLRYNGTCRT